MQLGQIVLTLLYFLQGLMLGLPAGGIQLLYAHNKDVGIFTLCILPWAFKFIWSPLLDYYFIEKIGKRKTYIIPFLFIIGVIFLWASQLEHTLLNMFYYYFVIMLFISTMDTAVDGWSVTLLDNVAQQSVCQTFGQQIGWFISQSIFTLLHQKGVITFPQYEILLGIVCIVVSLSLIGVQEKNPDEVVHYTSLFHQIKQVKGLYYNKNLRFLCIFLLLQRIGVGFMDVAAPVVLVRGGMEKQYVSEAQIFVFFCTFWIPLAIGYFVSGKKKENTLAVSALTYQTINMAFFALDYYEYQKNKPGENVFNSFQYLFCFQLLIHEIFRKIYTVCTFAFVAEIAEPQLAGMQITILASMHNFSRTVLDPLILQSTAYFNIYVIISVCVVYQAIVLKRYGDEYRIKQFISKENWALHTEETLDNYQELKEISNKN